MWVESCECVTHTCVLTGPDVCRNLSVLSDIAVGRIIFCNGELTFQSFREREKSFLFYTIDVFLGKRFFFFNQCGFLEGYVKIWWDGGLILYLIPRIYPGVVKCLTSCSSLTPPPAHNSSTTQS